MRCARLIPAFAGIILGRRCCVWYPACLPSQITIFCYTSPVLDSHYLILLLPLVLIPFISYIIPFLRFASSYYLHFLLCLLLTPLYFVFPYISILLIFPHYSSSLFFLSSSFLPFLPSSLSSFSFLYRLPLRDNNLQFRICVT